MDIVSFVITPIVGGVIGYITNWIAIKDKLVDIIARLCVTSLTKFKKYCLKLKLNSVCNIIDDKLYYKLKGTILEK